MKSQMQQRQSPQPGKPTTSDELAHAHNNNSSLNNPYITSVLRRSSQMTQNQNPKRSISNKKPQQDIIDQRTTEEELSRSQDETQGGAGSMKKSNLLHKRGSGKALSTFQQNQVKSATGGPDHYDDKSGSRHPSNDDQTSSHNTNAQKQSQGNSRSRQSRQSRQSAAKERKAHLTERIKSAGGTGASSSLNSNFVNEKRRALPHTDSMQKFGVQALQNQYVQKNSYEKNDGSDDQNDVAVNGPFKMNQFNLEEMAQEQQNKSMIENNRQKAYFQTNKDKVIKQRDGNNNAGDIIKQDGSKALSVHTAPYKDNDLDQSKNESDIQIDPNPFARRDKSRKGNERQGREKRSRIKSGVFDESSSNHLESVANDPISNTPDEPKIDSLQKQHFPINKYSKPSFRVENNNEHNITNISLSVSQMNITADADVIEEQDESETFRPNQQSLEEQQIRLEPHMTQNGTFQSKYSYQEKKQSSLTKLNSGRTRQNKPLIGSNETQSMQKPKPSINTYARLNQSTTSISQPRSPSNYNFPKQQQKPRTSIPTRGATSPTKDTQIVYRAIDDNKNLIQNDNQSNSKKYLPHIDSEYTSSSPTKFEQLMKPVRQQSTGQSSNQKLLSPTKSQRFRHSLIQGSNQKENRGTGAINELASVHSNTNQNSQPDVNRTQNSNDQYLYQQYNSKHNFISNTLEKKQIYHTSDERKRRANLSISSLNETSDIIGNKEKLTQIDEEVLLKEKASNRNMPLKRRDDLAKNTQAFEYQDKYDEEPEAEAKTQMMQNNKWNQHAIDNKNQVSTTTSYQRQRKSQVAVSSTPSVLSNKNFVGKGSPRLNVDKKSVAGGSVIDTNSSIKKTMSRYSSQNQMLSTHNFRKDDQKGGSLVASSGQGAIVSKTRQHTQRFSQNNNHFQKQQEEEQSPNNPNQSFISHQSEKYKRDDKNNSCHYNRSQTDSRLENSRIVTDSSPLPGKKVLKNQGEIEVENLKTIIVAMNQKLKAKDDVERQFKEYKKHSNKISEGRDELRMQMQESVSAFKEQQMKNQKFQELIIEENKNWNLVDQEKDQIISAKDNEIRELRALLNQKDRQLQEVQIQREQLSSQLDQNNQIDTFFSKIKDQRMQNQNEFEDIFDQHARQLEKEYDERQKLIKEKEEMQQLIRRLREENDELVLHNDKLRFESDQIRNQNEMDEHQARQLKEQREYMRSVESHLQHQQTLRDDLQNKINNISQKCEDLRNDDHQNFQAIQVEISRINQEKDEAVQQSADKDIKIKNLMQTNLELQAKLHQLNQLVAIKDDLTDQLHQLNNYVEEILAQKKNMQRELDTAGDYLLEQEEKTNQANLTALDLLNKLKEADEEIENLKRMIQILKSQVQQYVPVSGDATDEALADFINNQYDKSKLKVMFIRLNPGIYQFGSKKICIRVEQGKIHIRVGGGYLYIEEFLDQYTTLELEKALREGIDPMGGESSPMRVPALSNGMRSPGGAQRSTSPKKLLHKVSAHPVPGTNQVQWKAQNHSPRKTDRMFQ